MTDPAARTNSLPLPAFLPVLPRARSLRARALRWLKHPLLGRYAVDWQWPRNVDAGEWDRMSVASRSGATLAGLYGPAHAERKGVVVCAHPLRRDAKGFFLTTGRAEFLRRNGYDVVLFDFNGFGESSPGDFKYADDVLAAAEYARARAAGLPVFALAACFGAVWTLGAATLDHPFAGIVVEAPVTTMQEYYAQDPFARAFFELLWRLFPRSAAIASPISAAANLRGTPQLLLIAGLDDTVAPADMSRRLYEACGLPRAARRVCYVERAEHLRAFEVAPDDYAQSVLAFFDRASAESALVW